MKDREKVRAQLRHVEQSGGPPRTKVYKDSEGHPTIATGYNLDQGGARETLTKLGINYEAVRQGEPLTVEQAQTLEDHVIITTENICREKLGNEHFDKLSPEQQAAVISATMSPIILGPNLIKYIQDGNYDAAGDEIQYRSNKYRDPGIQHRRDSEAKLFRSGIMPSSSTKTDQKSSLAELNSRLQHLEKEKKDLETLSKNKVDAVQKKHSDHEKLAKRFQAKYKKLDIDVENFKKRKSTIETQKINLEKVKEAYIKKVDAYKQELRDYQSHHCKYSQADSVNYCSGIPNYVMSY